MADKMFDKSARELFAYNLRRIRQAQGISQEKLALICDVNRTYVSAIERTCRNLSLNIVDKFAQGLNVPVDEFFKPIE